MLCELGLVMDLNEIQSLYDNGKIEELRKIGVKTLQEWTHPDKFSLDDKERATELFKKITNLLNKKIMVGSYELHSKLYNGDLSTLHQGSKNGNPFLIKIANSSSSDLYLNNEFNHLNKILDDPHNDFKFNYLPLPINQLSIKTKGKRPRRTNILRLDSGLLTLQDVFSKFSTGIDGRHIAWMLKRCLVALGCAYQHGITHNAILPNHILIKPENHQAKLIGWTFSLKSGEKPKILPKGAKPFCSPVVLDKGNTSLETDLYMLSKTFMRVSAVLPSKLDNFLISFLMKGESRHPWDLHEDLDRILLDVYGPPQFINLEV